MQKLKILSYYNPLLKTKIKETPLEVIKSSDFQKAVKDSVSFVKDYWRSAIGLAANQLGFTYRFFLMEVEGEYVSFINPKIITSSGKTKTKEGCLSFDKEEKYKIKRKSFVELEYTNLLGEVKRKVFNGIEAVCVQHEIDHLNGITMLDRYREQENKKGRFK